LSEEPYYECKVLPKQVKSPLVIGIYGNKVANILWAGKDTSVFIQENKELNKSYKKYFDYLWKTAK
jgi:hypothetical protein